MRTRRAPVALAAFLAAACGGKDSVARVPDVPASPNSLHTAVLMSRTGRVVGRCTHDGLWRVCSLVDRLEKAGLVPRVDSTAPPEHLPFFHAPGTVVHLGLGELHTFVYDDTAALARDIAALDTTRVAPRGGTYTWSSTPTFVRSGNLAAVLLTPNERQIERIQLALEAGPPQPNPPGHGAQ